MRLGFTQLALAMPSLSGFQYAGCPNAKNTYHKCTDYCKAKLLEQVAPVLLERAVQESALAGHSCGPAL